MKEIPKLSLIELVQSIQQRNISPIELMKAVLSRIDQTHDDLNAVVAMVDTDLLLEQAAESEKRIMSNQVRPLEGIPFGVKDLEDVKGLVTSYGSIPFRDNIAKTDSIQVQRLKAAGAIVVGKTNTPEFGYTAITKNRVYGATRSPWDLKRTPGGSSGGSAAAIAGGILPLATSSDGGGSVRIPASFVGAFGLKPSFGRVPIGPIEYWDHGHIIHYGMITKTVEDAALFLDQVAGPSPYDPGSLPKANISYREIAKKPITKPLRFGFSPDLGYAIVQSDILAAVEEGIKVFEHLGHIIKTINNGPPNFGGQWEEIFNAFETSSKLINIINEHESEFGRAFLSGAKTSSHLDTKWWHDLTFNRARLNNWCAEVFDTVDLLITPTVPFDPPPAKGPFPEKTEEKKQIPAAVSSFTLPFNLSWHPAVTVRAGISKEGLPIGLQIVGPRHREDLVLQAAHAFEIERPWHPDWPTTW